MRLKSAAYFLVVAGFVLPAGKVMARTDEMKSLCVNCHTMHNSQGNSNMTPGTIGAQGGLLTNTCYGCHSGNNVLGGRPNVLHTSEPPYTTGAEPGHNTLAGGDFYWVSMGAELKGHNVSGVSLQSTRTAPGSNPPREFSASQPLTCAGTNGCHGDLSKSGDVVAMSQTHHAPEHSRGFRFLDGISGFEDPDYELVLSLNSDGHNQYKGSGRTGDDDSETSTISHLCAKCHGAFHSGGGDAGIWNGTSFGTDPWIRHPVDYDMGGLGGEYAGYGSGGTYNFITPVGSDNVSVALSSVNLASPAKEAIVVCVSCHRAHGSPYDYDLRWDYKKWPDTGGYNGCGDCHTEKN